jgi:carbon starvation protein CstA
MDRLPMKPTWRKPAGIGLILLIILIWAVIVASAADLMAGQPWPVQAIFYVVAGIVWILPLKPLLRWMETGRWRQPGAS